MTSKPSTTPSTLQASKLRLSYNTNLCMSATSIRGALTRLSALASLVCLISWFTR